MSNMLCNCRKSPSVGDLAMPRSIIHATGLNLESDSIQWPGSIHPTVKRLSDGGVNPVIGIDDRIWAVHAVPGLVEISSVNLIYASICCYVRLPGFGVPMFTLTSLAYDPVSGWQGNRYGNAVPLVSLRISQRFRAAKVNENEAGDQMSRRFSMVLFDVWLHNGGY